MELTTIPLSQIQSHPANCNQMPKELFEKLVTHIQRTDRYPPVIVRPWAPPLSDASSSQEHSTRFQVLDGHHRIQALRKIGGSEARCVVWQVSDSEALLLLTTLNRLQGRDDPRKRAAIMTELSSLPGTNPEDLADLVPESIDELNTLLKLSQPPPSPAPPQPLDQMPVAVHFFLLPDDSRRLEAKLKNIGGSREHALLTLVSSHQ